MHQFTLSSLYDRSSISVRTPLAALKFSFYIISVFYSLYSYLPNASVLPSRGSLRSFICFGDFWIPGTIVFLSKVLLLMFISIIHSQ